MVTSTAYDGLVSKSKVIPAFTCSSSLLAPPITKLSLSAPPAVVVNVYVNVSLTSGSVVLSVPTVTAAVVSVFSSMAVTVIAAAVGASLLEVAVTTVTESVTAVAVPSSTLTSKVVTTSPPTATWFAVGVKTNAWIND